MWLLKVLSAALLLAWVDSTSTKASKRNRMTQSNRVTLGEELRFDDRTNYVVNSEAKDLDDSLLEKQHEVQNSSLPTGGSSKGYWREIKAIIGGVLGFWGGVGGLGAVFLIVVLSQKYCCKRNEDKDGNG